MPKKKVTKKESAKEKAPSKKRVYNGVEVISSETIELNGRSREKLFLADRTTTII